MMRGLLVTLLLLAPLAAQAGTVRITEKLLQKGAWVDAACKAAEAKRASRDPSYQPMKCLCLADIRYVELAGIPQARELNQAIRAGAQRATYGDGDQANAPVCRGKQITLRDADAGSGLSEHRYDVSKAFENDDLLILALGGWSYDEGAAHGNAWSGALNIDKTRGVILSEKDMIGDDYLALNAYLYQQLKTMDGSFLSQCEKLTAGDRMCPSKPELYLDPIEGGMGHLRVQKNGLAIQFDAYAVGPYAAGPITLAIPAKFVKHPAILKLYGASHARG